MSISMAGAPVSAPAGEALVREYVARAGRLAPLFPRARPLPDLPAYRDPPSPARNLALELTRSILYERADSLWNGKPQQYFESLTDAPSDSDATDAPYDADSLAP